jgi:hypothetical protein
MARGLFKSNGTMVARTACIDPNGTRLSLKSTICGRFSFFRIDIMDKVEDELEFHRHNGDLEMVVRLEWRNLVQPELRAVPHVDGPSSKEVTLIPIIDLVQPILFASGTESAS